MRFIVFSYCRYLSFVVLSFCSQQVYAINHPAARAVVSVEIVNPRQTVTFCHASTIAYKNGDLVAAWLAGTKEAAPDVGVWLARLHDGRWGAPVRVADGRTPDGAALTTINPVLFAPRNGPLMLFYERGQVPADWHAMRMISLDGGYNWSKAKPLGAKISGPAKDKPVQLSNGVVIAGSNTMVDGWRIHFERSTDGGNTWALVYPAVAENPVEAIQPSILDHGNGWLQAVTRTKNGYVFSTESRDWGKTWGKLTSLDIPNPNSGLDALTLADGRDLIVTNPLPYVKDGWDRHKLTVFMSTDHKTFRPVLDLENEANQEFSYPAVIQSPDGKVHITYTWKKIHIKHVVLDPRRLEIPS
jgi:predicted neuraminidase